MAELPTKKISELTETTDFDGTEVFHCLDPFNNKATLQNIRNFVSASNEVIINSIDDFPAPVAGVITLESGKRYTLNNVIVTSNRFVFPAGATVTFSSVDLGNALVYTGTGTMFSGLDFSIVTFELMLCQAPSGTFFDMDGTGSFFIVDSIFISCQAIGEIKNNSFSINFAVFSDYGTGFVCKDRTDTLPRVNISLSLVRFDQGKNQSTSILRVEGNINRVALDINAFQTNGANESILDLDESLRTNNTNITLTTPLFDTSLGGQVFATGSLQQDYIRAVFFGTIGAPDSTVSVQIGFEGATEVTTINTANTREIINARILCQLPERILFQDVVTFDNVTNTLTARLLDGTTAFNHGLSDNDRLFLKSGPGASLPPEFNETTEYFVVTATAQTFQLSLTQGGPAISFTTNGTITNYYRHLVGVNAANWLVYIGIEKSKIAFNGSASILTVSGQDKIIHMDLVKFDTNFAATTDLDLFGKGSRVTINSSDPQGSSIHGLVELSEGESLRLFVTNETDTTNLIATDANIAFLKA